MSSIKPYGAGYRVQLYVKGQRDSRTFDTKKAAQLWAAQRTIDLQTIASGQEGSLRTVQDAFDKYAWEVAPTHKGERWERVRLAKLGRDFPRLTMDRITSTHIQRWRDQRLTEVGPASVLREMKLLTSVFEQARREWKWLAVNPCKDVRKPPAPAHRSRVISRQEARKLLRALDYPRRETARHSVAHAFLLALRTGMRAGELAGLTWADVHPAFVRLPQTKNGTARDVPLSAKARRILAKMRGYHRDSVFGVTAGSIDVHFRAARARAGLSGMNWHDTRHTAATWIAAKLPLLELCKMFGWRDPKQAMIYFNPSASDIADKL
jgi:integrase